MDATQDRPTVASQFKWRSAVDHAQRKEFTAHGLTTAQVVTLLDRITAADGYVDVATFPEAKRGSICHDIAYWIAQDDKRDTEAIVRQCVKNATR